MKFITIKESNNASHLVVLKSKLESEGIRCRMDGELSNQVLNYIPMISVKLQVWEEDMDLAMRVLVEIEELEVDKATLTCSQCHSTDLKIHMNLKNIGILLMTLLLSIFMIPTNRKIRSYNYTCQNCGYRFRI